MWISRDAARSDVALAPGGLLVLGGLVALLRRLPIWPSGLTLLVIEVVIILLIMVAWPLWLARQRGETRLAGDESLRPGDLPPAVMVAAPVALLGMVVLATRPGVPLGQAIAGGFAVVQTIPEGILALVSALALALGTWLVLSLVARRAAEGYSSMDMPIAAALRSWGMGAAAATTLLGLLTAAGGSGNALQALLRGVSVAVTVLVVDRLVAHGARTTRAALMAPMIVVAVLWVVRGWLFSDALLTNLAAAAFGAGIALCMAVLVAIRRPTVALLLPLAAVMWQVPALPSPV